MTVKELIEKLKHCDENSNITISSMAVSEDGICYDILPTTRNMKLYVMELTSEDTVIYNADEYDLEVSETEYGSENDVKISEEEYMNDVIRVVK